MTVKYILYCSINLAHYKSTSPSKLLLVKWPLRGSKFNTCMAYPPTSLGRRSIFTRHWNVFSQINSLFSSDVIWRYRSTLALVMACCLTTPSNYLNQFYQHSPESNFTRSIHKLIPPNGFGDYTLKITTIYPRGQWVKRTSWAWCYYPQPKAISVTFNKMNYFTAHMLIN